MDDKEFYYLDTPSVPAVRQSLIDVVSVIEVGKPIVDEELHYTHGYVSHVKDSDGEVIGSLVYFPGQAFGELTESDEEVEDEEDLEDLDTLTEDDDEEDV